MFRRVLRGGDDDADAFRRRLEKSERAYLGRAEPGGVATTTRLGRVLRVFGVRRRLRSQRESTELPQTIAKRLERRHLPRERFQVVDVADAESVFIVHVHLYAFVSAFFLVDVASPVHRLPRVVVLSVVLVLAFLLVGGSVAFVLGGVPFREPGAEEIFPLGLLTARASSHGIPRSPGDGVERRGQVPRGVRRRRRHPKGHFPLRRAGSSPSPSRVDAEAHTPNGDDIVVGTVRLDVGGDGESVAEREVAVSTRAVRDANGVARREIANGSNSDGAAVRILVWIRTRVARLRDRLPLALPRFPVMVRAVEEGTSAPPAASSSTVRASLRR